MRERGRLVWVLTDPPTAFRVTKEVTSIAMRTPGLVITRWVPTGYVKVIDGEDAEVYARE